MGAYLFVAAGSALGGMSRYFTSGLMARLLGETFPFGTLAVNISGSALIGLIATLSIAEGKFLLGPSARLFLMTGFCGGFTTFSTFSLETLNLVREGEWGKALANAALSLIVCLAGVWAGHVLGLIINER